jgi:hypothetical protein
MWSITHKFVHGHLDVIIIDDDTPLMARYTHGDETYTREYTAAQVAVIFKGMSPCDLAEELMKTPIYAFYSMLRYHIYWGYVAHEDGRVCMTIDLPWDRPSS